MPFTYAIGDLHGRLDVLEACLAKIGQREAGTVVFLGDYIDRGPNSKGVIERLMAGSQDHHQWIVLKGNHEEIANIAHDDNSMMNWWLYQCGGVQTLDSYDGRLPQDHLVWMQTLPLFHRDQHRLYVHAGIKKDEPWQSLNPEVLLWIRHRRDVEVPELNGLHVVHGHTPYEDGPELLMTRTNLDVKTFKTGRGVIAVFDDNISGGPVDTIEIRCGYALPREITLGDSPE